MNVDKLKMEVVESYSLPQKSGTILCLGEGLNTILQIQDQRSLCFGCEFDTNPKEKIDVERRVLLCFFEFYDGAKIKKLVI